MKQARRRAAQLLAETLAPAILDRVVSDITAAVAEGEEADLAPQELDRARQIAAESAEAQRRYHAALEAAERRREKLRLRLVRLQGAPLLEVHTEALQETIAEARGAGVGSVDLELASIKHMQAIDVQLVRAMAEQALSEAAEPAVGGVLKLDAVRHITHPPIHHPRMYLTAGW
jgi:hypothetical protein